MRTFVLVDNFLSFKIILLETISEGLSFHTVTPLGEFGVSLVQFFELIVDMGDYCERKCCLDG